MPDHVPVAQHDPDPINLGRIGLWTAALDGVSSSAAVECAAMLEDLGFDALWIPEWGGRDPFIMASRFLASTTRLRVATGCREHLRA